MISAVLATLNDQRRLGETLAALVPAAMEGLVRQVIIADAGSSDATLEIAEDSGAMLVAGGLRAGIAAAREAWLLLLDPGARLPPGWEQQALAHVTAGPGPALFRLGPRRGLLSMLAPSPAVGLLARRGDLSGGETLAELARAAKRPATLAIAAKRAD